MRLTPMLGLAFLFCALNGCSTAPSDRSGSKAVSSDPGATPSGIVLVDIIPEALSGETNQDSEPFLAVHSDPNILAASAFTPNPAGRSSSTAPIFISTDGGETWTLNAIVPSATMTCDITQAFGGAASNLPRGKLYNGIIRSPCTNGITTLGEMDTTDIAASGSMHLRNSRDEVDQPFIQVIQFQNKDRIFIGNNDFRGPNGQTATLDLSTDGGAKYKPIRLEKRKTNPSNAPSVRPAVAKNGTVYVAFFGWRSFSGDVSSGTARSDVVVVRDDSGGTSVPPFAALKDPSDHLAGRLVVTDRTIPWENPWPDAGPLGQERIGSSLSIAVDPSASKTVYLAWGDRTGGDIYTIHVRRSGDGGQTWSDDLRTLSNSTNPALAISDNGTVGFLYQQVVGSGGAARWMTHIEQTKDAFGHIKDSVLANTPAAEPPMVGLPYLGDYNYLLAVGGEFRGIFSANNKPDPADFPSGMPKYQRHVNLTTMQLLDGGGKSVNVSIDPFYFRIPVLQ